MKKVMMMLVVVLLLYTGMTGIAAENAFVGRWYEDSELGGSIILRSDGSFEGNIMLFYEMKGSYTLSGSSTAMLHPESVSVFSGMEQYISSGTTKAAALLKQLDGTQLVLSEEGTLSFFGMKMLRDESYKETAIINDSRLEGQWELKDHADELDQMMFYFTPDGIVYSAYDGMIRERTYTFDGTTVVMGEENTLSAVLQEDGTLKVELAGTYVKTKAYDERGFDAVAGLYGHEQSGYISGYYITPTGSLLRMSIIPGVVIEWRTMESNLTIAGNRIGIHDDLGNRFYAMIKEETLTREEWTIKNNRWVRDDEQSEPIHYITDELESLMEMDGFSFDLPKGLPGLYKMSRQDVIIKISPDGTAVWNGVDFTVKAKGSRVAIFSEGSSGVLYLMTYKDGTLTISSDMMEATFERVAQLNDTEGNADTYDGLFAFSIQPEGVTIDGLAMGRQKVTELTIPATLYGLPVVAIKEEAFRDEDQLVSVTVEEGVQSIGANAFSDCKALETVVLPDSIVSMGNGLFSSCRALRSVVLPSGITIIPDSLFYDCRNLDTIAIPEGVTGIGRYAFARCASLEEILLPPALKEIGHFAFMESGIRSLFIPEGVEYFHASMIYNADNLQEVYFPRSITHISDGYVDGNYSYAYSYKSSVTFYLLNSDYALSQNLWHKVFMESYDVRENDQFTYAVLEDGTLSITGWKEDGKQLVIPGEIDGMTVSAIGEEAFMRNRSIESVYIEEGVKTIGKYAFFECSMKAIRLPSTIKTLKVSSLANSSVKSLYLPEGLEVIEDNALSIESAVDIFIPASVQKIGKEAFGYFKINATLYVYDQSTGHKHANYRGMKAEIVTDGEITQAEDGTNLKNGISTLALRATPTPSPAPTPTPAPTEPPVTPTPVATATPASIERGRYVFWIEAGDYDPTTDTLYLPASDIVVVWIIDTKTGGYASTYMHTSGFRVAPETTEGKMVAVIHPASTNDQKFFDYYILVKRDDQTWIKMINTDYWVDNAEIREMINRQMAGAYLSSNEALNWVTEDNTIDSMNFVFAPADITKRYTLCAETEGYDAQKDTLSIRSNDSVELKIIDNETGNSLELSELPGASFFLPYGHGKVSGMQYTAHWWDSEILFIYDGIVQDNLRLEILEADCDHSEIVINGTYEEEYYVEFIDDEKHRVATKEWISRSCRNCDKGFSGYKEGILLTEEAHSLNEMSVCVVCGYMQNQELCKHSNNNYELRSDLSVPEVYFDITEETHRIQFSEKYFCLECGAYIRNEICESIAIEHYFEFDDTCECGYKRK